MVFDPLTSMLLHRYTSAFQVYVKDLNDSIAFGVPAVVLGHFIQGDLELSYALRSGFVLVGTFLTQNIIFLPKASLGIESFFSLGMEV